MKDGSDPMRSRPPAEQTRMGTRGPEWWLAIRTLVVAACLLVAHDAMMTSASAHGTNAIGGHDHAVVDPSMVIMTMGSFVDSMGEVTILHHPAPMHEGSDCGVIREASMPASQSLTAPDVVQDGATYPPDVAADSSVATKISSNARAPTISPRTRQALLQIFRV